MNDGEHDKMDEQDMSAYLITKHGGCYDCLGCDGYEIAKTRSEAENIMRNLYLETYEAAGSREEYDKDESWASYCCFKIAVKELDKILEHWSEMEPSINDSLYDLLTDEYSLNRLNDIYDNVL